MVRFSLITLALIGAAGIAQAQPAKTPLDPNGRPYVGVNDWHSGPGDPGASGKAAAQLPDAMGRPQEQAMAPRQDRVRREPAFKDEYGFRYDERGDRLDAKGNVISPHTR